jgi:hypothetical protein
VQYGLLRFVECLELDDAVIDLIDRSRATDIPYRPKRWPQEGRNIRYVSV